MFVFYLNIIVDVSTFLTLITNSLFLSDFAYYLVIVIYVTIALQSWRERKLSWLKKKKMGVLQLSISWKLSSFTAWIVFWLVILSIWDPIEKIEEVYFGPFIATVFVLSKFSIVNIFLLCISFPLLTIQFEEVITVMK